MFLFSLLSWHWSWNKCRFFNERILFKKVQYEYGTKNMKEYYSKRYNMNMEQKISIIADRVQVQKCTGFQDQLSFIVLGDSHDNSVCCGGDRCRSHGWKFLLMSSCPRRYIIGSHEKVKRHVQDFFPELRQPAYQHKERTQTNHHSSQSDRFLWLQFLGLR